MTKDFKHSESILAVRNATLQIQGFQEGFHSWIGDYENFTTVAEQELIISPRKSLEGDETFRQLLPYTVIKDTDEIGRTRYAVYRRCKGIGENRLLGKVSIGFGGHIDLADIVTYDGHPSTVDLAETITVSNEREIMEEVAFTDTAYYCLDPLGILIDNSDAVGRVHVGLVQMLEIFDGTVAELKEDELEFIGMMTAEELEISHLDFENWSRILIDSKTL